MGELSAERYQNHLNRVSRSFAFCIEQLDDEFRESISLAYLLLRILDTVEDSKWRDGAEQTKAFAGFRDFMATEPTLKVVQAWTSSFPKDIPEGEALLLADAHAIFHGFHGLSEGERELIAKTALTMATGMEHFSKREVGVIELRSGEELDLYCDFVAGIIGELIVELYCLKYPAGETSWSEQIQQAMALGRTLQKINILKDQGADQAENRRFVPSLPLVLETLVNDMRVALPLVIDGFRDNRRLRIFCAWSLGIGLDLLPRLVLGIEKSSRAKVEQVKQFLADNIDSQATLRDFFNHQVDELKLAIAERNNR